MALPPKIAIIGAGPAGLTLARLLHLSKVKTSLTVYELDASPTSRPDQGGTLDLHTDTGLAAIQKCQLWDSFRKHARYEGGELIMADKNATKLIHLRGGPRDRPEIDRFRLREILLNSVPRDCIRWGQHLREVKEGGMLRFDGRKEMDGPFDLIVGADGAWSKVRQRLNGLKPAYSGVSGYEMEIKAPATTCPGVNRMVGRGGFFGLSDQKTLNAQRMGDDSIKVRTWYTCPESETKDALEHSGRKATAERILERYQDWAPEMTDILQHADLATLKQWTLYELPVGCRWEHKKGLTLIGDAASLTTPFSGEGVNKAMQDSLELAELIGHANSTLDHAVKSYERSMFPRAKKLQAQTMSYKENMFRPDTPLGLITGMLRTMADEKPSILAKLVGTAPVLGTVYSYFWLRTQIGLAARRLWKTT